ncbi:cullin-2-like isoform X1 [Gordionus sp. m RMFG-2023]|uniref:cullin-2-like isoform X1 n=1 Tax=Gordionus sp. m RMFG-2023 TaxID=3053472 RepID=UPI0031FC66D9
MSLKPRKVNFDGVWTCIQNTLEGVMTLSKVPKNVWNDRFLDIYTICTAIPDPLCEELYQSTKIFLEVHVKKIYQEILNLDDDILLFNYHKHWLDYSKGATYLNQLYGYLNAQYIRKQKYKEADVKYGRLFVDLHPVTLPRTDDNSDPLLRDTNPGLLLEVGDLALVTWRHHVIEPLAGTLRRLLMAAILRDRRKGDHSYTNFVYNSSDALRSESDDSIPLLREIIFSFVEVERNTKHLRKLYENVFEIAYLEETGEFYKNYSNYLLNDEKLTCSQYMQKVVAKLADEVKRNKNLVDPNTLPKAESVCQKRLVTDVLPFLHAESKEMIRQEMIKDLSLMFSILNPIEGSLGALIDTLGQHITDVCMAKINELENENDPTMFVESILAIHSKYKTMIKITFDSDTRFLASLDKACSIAINYKSDFKIYCRAPEQLSRYCDILLKKNPKILPESEVETKLNNVVTLFSYLKDKDTFQQFYANMLAKRLIFGSSQSLDAEENMINKLKTACGYDFTNKLYRMFTDIKLSKDHNEGFQGYLKRLTLSFPLPNFSVFILQAGAWPINQANLPSFQAPIILENCLTQFELYYSSNFNGRKLMWLFHLSMGELKITYLPKPYFLSLNTFQMAILLLFNNNTSMSPCNTDKVLNNCNANLVANNAKCNLHLSYDHIQRETGLANQELKRHLYALLDFFLLNIYKVNLETNTLNLLTVKPISQALTDPKYLETLFCDMETCKYSLNTDFQSKKSKIKLSIPPLPASLAVLTNASGNIDEELPSTSTRDNEQTHMAVEEDRKLYLQAVIVRIMKSRKVAQHNQLVQEVIEQSKSRFVPSVNVIKKCIETLIEKQYVKRKTDFPEEYSYIA